MKWRHKSPKLAQSIDSSEKMSDTFYDDFPLRPSIPDGMTAPSRAEERSDTEIRSALSTITRLLDGLHRRNIVDATGRQLDVLARDLGVADIGAWLGFRVYPGTRNGYFRIVPSVISGIGAAGNIPTMQGVPLDNIPPPEMLNSKWVGIWMEMRPVSILRYKNTEEEESLKIYGISHGELVSGPEIRTYPGYDAMNEDTDAATIDVSSGNVKNNGKYVIPLATFNDGTWVQAGYYGPIGFRMCESGTIVVNGPMPKVDQNG